jgi:hypothetical protein
MSTPADPPAVWATVHLYLACCRVIDAMAEDGICDCMEYDELRGILFAVRACATFLESQIPVHPAVRKAEEHFIKKLIAFDGADEILYPRAPSLSASPRA